MSSKKKTRIEQHITEKAIEKSKKGGISGDGDTREKLRISGNIKKEDFQGGRIETLPTISPETRLLAEASILGGLLARNNGTIQNNVNMARDIVQAHLVRNEP
jgi:hypothetical protein